MLRTLRRALPTLTVLIATLPMIGQTMSAPEAGVSRELARHRAQLISNLRYQLSFGLKPHADTMPGKETVTFTLSSAEFNIPIDYRDGTLTAATLNGKDLPIATHNGHLVLPAAQLLTGDNTLETTFTSRIAQAGAAITRYEDKEDNTEYFYSLFVPMDASMAFPCFDQPDLKGRFTLEVTTPKDWTVISNSRESDTMGEINDIQPLALMRHRFEATKPISTYLFAFAAGPWAKLAGRPGEPDLYVRKSQLARAQTEAPHVQQMTARGITFLSDYFQQPFPFPKYDLVLIPGFPFGGMEHAGATFLNETGVLFRSAPTATDLFNRDTLVLHELSHQWFGDLVTMRWFDDLWLKEGFAQFMAYRALAELEPGSDPWKHMYEDIKPLAYGIDETEGTTPIFQQIPNLKDAKSAYGAIVYQKAPSILKQLQFRLGDEPFRNGLRTYLKDHAYSNAEWSDLVTALQTSSGQDVKSWANAWVLQRGMPEITTAWTCDASGHLASLQLHQHDVLGTAQVWPMSLNVLLAYNDPAAPFDQLRARLSGATNDVPGAKEKRCPAYVFANWQDQGYGRILLDAKSEAAVRSALEHSAPFSTDLPGVLVPQRDMGMGNHVMKDATDNPLTRTMLWGALWDNVHTARSAPRAYVELALKDLPTQNDETLARLQYGRAGTALQRYLSQQAAAPLIAKLERTATDRMLHAPTTGLRIVAFRALTANAETPAARATLKDLLAQKLTVPGVDLRPLDRWTIVGRLIAIGDTDAPTLLAAESKRDTTDDGRRYAWSVAAAAPDAATKARYWQAYTTPPTAAGAQQEDWLTQSLRPFNQVRQQTLTLPYLQRSLQQLPEIKQDRRIFYLGAWLGAFLEGQTTPEAEAIVQQWLKSPSIDPDLRRKVLENIDPLQRTVRIRTRFPE